MLFLIDGYNLLHAVGWAKRRMPGRQLEKARLKLLNWLADEAVRAPEATLRVIFDAQNGPTDSAEWTHRGIQVRFARDGTADDFIEQTLDAMPRPRLATVVSNDTRLHESARRAGSRAWSSAEFLDWLEATKQATPESRAATAEKPDGPADASEVTDLLRAFGEPKRK